MDDSLTQTPPCRLRTGHRNVRLVVHADRNEGQWWSEPELPLPACLVSLFQGDTVTIVVEVAVTCQRGDRHGCDDDVRFEVKAMTVDGRDVPDQVRKCVSEGEWQCALDLLVYESTAE